MNEERTIIMVYNADGDAISVLADAVHKIMAPGSYPCSLCSVSYGPLAMRSKWRQFLGRLPYRNRALHRDEFLREFGPRGIELPVILAQDGAGQLDVLLSKQDLDRLDDVDGLIAATERALACA